MKPLRIVAVLMFLALMSIHATPPQNTGRIEIHITRANTPEGIADVALTMQGPYPVASAGALASLYTPNPALTPEMRAQIDDLIAVGERSSISVEVIVNVARQTEAQLLGLPAPTNIAATPATAAAAAAAAPPQVNALTDAKGNYTFNNLAPGRYQIRAQRDGYFFAPPSGAVTLNYPTTTSTNAFVENSKPAAVDLTMIPGATVSGRVRDPNGNPLFGAQVSAYQLSYQNARPAMQSVNSKTTDDRGEYRLFSLPPGEYYLGVTPRRAGSIPSSQDAYARTFFPGTADAKLATRVKVTAGGEVSGIDIGVRGDATGKISGRVVTSVVAANGQSAQASTFYLLPLDAAAFADTASMNFQNVATNRTNGQFEIRGILPGSYDLITMISSGTNNQMLGRAQVNVGGGSVDDITLRVNPGLPVRAHLTIDNAPPPFTMAAPAARGGLTIVNGVIQQQQPESTAPVPTPRNRVTLRSMEAYSSPFESAAQQNTAYDSSGVFTYPSVPEGRYFIAVTPLPPNAYVEDVRVAEHSVLDDGFVVGTLSGDIEVRVSTKGAKITGVVRDADQKIVPATRVVLVPAMSRRQNIALYKSATTDAKGSFSMNGIAPGEYKLFAWDFPFQGTAYMNADFMAPYEESGKAITIAAGASMTADLVTTSAQEKTK